jgi:hypothetical protein
VLLSEFYAIVRSGCQVPPADRVGVWARTCSYFLRCRAAPRLVELPEGVSGSCVPGSGPRAGRALHESQTPGGRVAIHHVTVRHGSVRVHLDPSHSGVRPRGKGASFAAICGFWAAQDCLHDVRVSSVSLLPASIAWQGLGLLPVQCKVL